MKAFWQGFEKRGASIIGRLPGVRSGLPKTVAPGVARVTKGPTSGVAVAPRSVAPPLPTPKAQPGAGKAQVPLPGASRAPTVPKPTTQAGAGVSSVAI